MLPALVLVDIAVFFFYLSRGMLKQKMQASFNIIRNWNRITERYHQIQKERKIDDKTLIRNFKDGISVPKQVSNKESGFLFNKFISDLSKITRNFI
jgi:hypothetical protein